MPFTQLRDFHLYFYQAPAVLKARVNMPGTITYPVTELTFDGVTLGDYTDVVADLTLLLGSTDGGDEYGRTRVQNVATSTTIPVGRVSQGNNDGELNVVDNAFVTVLLEFRVWSKLPYSAPSGIDYKDANIEVGDYNENPPPQANMGTGFADYIDDDDIITVAFDASDSYAVADGATIVSYAWNIEDGTVIDGALDEVSVTATFPAGVRYVSLTVVDSNDKPHSTRRLVLAVDPDNDPTIKFQVENHRIEMRGQTIAFGLLDNMLRSSVRDGSACIFWADEPITPSDRSHVLLYGYHQSDSFNIRATPTGLIRTTVLNCVDVAGRLASLPGFPQALQREPEEDEDGNPIDIMWALMPTLDMRKCLHYLAFWHSTALGVTDFLLPESLSDYPSMRLDSTGASLYDQINSRAQSCVPDHWLTCNIQGQLAVRPDWMLLDFDDRPADTAGTLTEDFWNDIRVDYTRPPRVYHLSSSAVVCSTDWLMLGGEKTLPLAFCNAPGTAFGQGVSESVTGEKLTISQEALNACEGHRYARLNARYGLFTIVEPTGDIQDFQPAHMLPVQLNISAATAAQRGLDFTTARGLVRSIDMRYNHSEFGTWVSPTLQWEREVIGLPAVTHIPDEPDDPDYEVPEPPPLTIPPDFGLVDGQDLVAGIGLDGYVYRTSNFQNATPTWDRVDTTIADTIYSWVVDPFSPGYIDGAGAINGWIVNDTDIYRVTDLFGSVVATSVYTFDEPTVAADFHWRSIQASFGAYFAEGANPWLLCVSYYGDTAGHTGTWATYSTDGGVTWADEVQITAHYNTTTPTRFNPIGVYASPKTPGLAYTAAYSETAEDAQAVGYVSVNWGASWTAYTDIDAGSGQAGSIHLPWPDNIDESIFYHGQLLTTVEEGTPDELMPFMGNWNNDTNTYTPIGYGVAGSINMTVHDDTPAGIMDVEEFLVISPPPTTKRMEYTVSWFASKDRAGTSSAVAINFQVQKHTTISQTAVNNFSEPAYGSSDSDTFTVTLNFAGGDWPANNVSVQSSPPTAISQIGARMWVNIIANCFGAGNFAEGVLNATVTVTEIELDNGTIYTPVEATGERSFRLKRITSGTVLDISPTDGSILYGVNRGHFGVRTYDSNRQYVVASVIGNDTSGDAADDLHAIYYSDDFGLNWTEVVAPVADTEAPAGRPAFEAAFGGDSEQILFIWGAQNYISYSDDGGSTVDSKAGNLAALGGTVYFIGICGGVS